MTVIAFTQLVEQGNDARQDAIGWRISDFIAQKKHITLENRCDFVLTGSRRQKFYTKDFTDDCRIGLAMRADPKHRLIQSVQLLAGTVEGTQSGPTCIDECLVDVE
jgi:hypothetical protein